MGEEPLEVEHLSVNKELCGLKEQLVADLLAVEASTGLQSPQIGEVQTFPSSCTHRYAMEGQQ